jgi:hypothetical protein
MIFIDFIKKTTRWLWPSLVIIIFSCVRKSIFDSLTLEQIQDGLLLYAGYLLCIIPIGSLLLKTKWFDDESKAALLILFVTYVFFEYSIIISTWEKYAGQLVEQYFYNKQNIVLIIVLIICGIGLIWILKGLNNMRKNRAFLLFTTIVLIIGPIIDALLIPNYKFSSDLFAIQQSDIVVNKAEIPKRIFWIILDEHPSSQVLDEAWGYKDTTFRSGLESLGFTVFDSCICNYNYTPFSIAATTYGAMLPVSGRRNLSVQQWLLLGERIRKSPVINFFREEGYEIHDLSFFDASNIKYFTKQAEIVSSSIVGVILLKFDIQRIIPELFYNKSIVDSVHALLSQLKNHDNRIFVYAHILMPHSPYLPLETNIIERNNHLLDPKNDQAFLRHVEYTDSIILNLFKKGLLDLTYEQRSNTMVILQADHGYKFLQRGGEDIKLRSSFGILNAVLWPNNKKAKFYNGMSSVNTFRILFRDLWGVKLSVLVDSSVNVFP